MLALLSQNSVKSRWVSEELESAFAKNAEGAQSVITPVLLDRIDSKDIPPSLRDVKWINLSEDYNEGIAELGRCVAANRQTSS